MKLVFSLNNKSTTVEVPVNRTLSDLLRTHGCWSVKHGCETGDCGNCAVLVDGQAVNSCMLLAAQIENKSVETFEMYGEKSHLKPLKEALMDFVELECNYCLPGLFLSVKALIDKIPDPTEEELVDALAGHVCRCVRKALPVERVLEAVNKIRGEY